MSRVFIKYLDWGSCIGSNRCFFVRFSNLNENEPINKGYNDKLKGILYHELDSICFIEFFGLKFQFISWSQFFNFITWNWDSILLNLNLFRKTKYVLISEFFIFLLLLRPIFHHWCMVCEESRIAQTPSRACDKSRQPRVTQEFGYI